MSKLNVQLTDVTLRDGLQSEAVGLSTPQKLELFQCLLECGFSRIELTSFSHPKWIPQLADSAAFCEGLFALESVKKNKSTDWMAFVPNEKGLVRFFHFPIRWASLFLATSETFHKKNINLSINDGVKQLTSLCNELKNQKRKIRIYLSTAFGCPYEKEIPSSQIESCVAKIAELGPNEIALSDTIGVASPHQIESVVKITKKYFPLDKIAMHLHNTYGLALANMSVALSLGVIKFDGTTGGLGGCPYAQGASGNVAIEEIGFFLKREGVSDSLNWNAIFKTLTLLEKWGVNLNSKIALIRKKGGLIYGI